MGKPDPPFPSFTTMSYELQKDNLRLPSYRESLLLRFHPYPQTRRKTATAAPLMQTVDRRWPDEPVHCATEEAESCVPLPHHPHSENNEDALNLNHAMGTDKSTNVKRRRSLTTLIIDLALLMTGTSRVQNRRYLAKVASAKSE